MIDVSELMTDPDFVQPVTIMRRTDTVGTDGLTIVLETAFPGVLASVQPAGGDTLALLPEALRVGGVLSIWTAFSLRQASGTALSDEVIWRGARYVVMTLTDWGLPQNGFYEAALVRKELVG